MTLTDFFIKLCSSLVPLIISFLLIFIRSFSVSKYTFSGVDQERESILEDEKSIEKFQTSNWAANAGQVLSYSGVSISTVLLVVAFTLQLELDPLRRFFLNIVIFTVGLSSLCYAFSLQFWNFALERRPGIIWLLRSRRIATSLQVVGWHGLFLSVILCVNFINTWIGLVFSILGSVGLVLTYEYKKIRT